MKSTVLQGHHAVNVMVEAGIQIDAYIVVGLVANHSLAYDALGLAMSTTRLATSATVSGPRPTPVAGVWVVGLGESIATAKCSVPQSWSIRARIAERVWDGGP
jgi:hypothetical protein